MVREKYALYATYASHIPDREMTAAEQKAFDKALAALAADEQRAIVLLVYEHFLVEAKADEVPDPIALPYGGKERKNTASFVHGELPPALRWILAKFVRQRVRQRSSAAK
uniref:BET bromodomain protein n=1 Tax=Marseillevirus LCMAC103 TaxID=2506604 RepID=A0A481YUX4_9VIRU|nr:MAG: BET bromodomain protein [Marseillevirus LCMAC103]